MGDLPRISIVTPSLNQAAYIERTLRSVLEQKYADLEYIVMEGGSTDGTLKVVERYRDRLAHFESGPDEGFGDAIRRGLERSTGEIVAWLNSDDVYAPGTLAFVARYFADHGPVDLIYSHRCRIDAAGRARGYWILPEHRDDPMLTSAMIPQETCFWRRSLLERAGNIDPTFRFAIDHELFARYMRSGARFARVDRCLGAFRWHCDSKTMREYATLGRPEVARIAEMHNLPRGPVARLKARLVKERVRLRSRWHVLRRRELPGALPGVGWDYDDLWSPGVAGAERSVPQG